MNEDKSAIANFTAPVKAGDKFGRWTAQRSGINKILCRCECGAQKEIKVYTLRKGQSRSCGCLHKEMMANRWKTHGHSQMREWRIWFAMKQRCYTKTHVYYRRYGGRGISVCEEWRNSFDAFFRDMGKCPKGMTLDRINNNGNYEPGNCRWATSDEQNNNRRDNRLLSAFGKTQTMMRWAKEYGIRFGTLSERLRRGFMSVEDAISRPVQIQVRKSEVD